MLTAKELKYWQGALDNAPISCDFDNAPTSKIVALLQEHTRSLHNRKNNNNIPTNHPDCEQRLSESEIWSQFGVLVHQLQESRVVIKRLVMLQQGNSPRRAKKKTSILPKLRISAPPLPSPKKPAFCGNDVEASLNAMRRHKNSALIQTQGCDALLKLIQQSKKRRIALAKQCALAQQWVCNSCLTRNKMDYSIIEQASVRCSYCSMPASEAALGAAAKAMVKKTLPESKGEVEIELINKSGGISIVVDAMRRYPQDTSVLQAGSFCLAEILSESPLLVSRIAECGGIREVLNVMHIFSTSIDENTKNKLETLTQCMGILASPALVQDDVVRIEADNFARVVVACIQDNLKTPNDTNRLQALACLALANLALKADRFVSLLISQYSAHRLVVETMLKDAYCGDAHVAASGLWMLVSLARDLADDSHASVRHQINQVGGVQIAVECMRAFPSSQAVQNNVKLLFTRLGVTQDKPPADNAADVVPESCSII